MNSQDTEIEMFKPNHGGRPTKYTPQFVAGIADILEYWLEKDEKNIFFEKFCYEQDLSEPDIRRFINKCEKFTKAYEKLKIKQRYKLFEGGLTKKYAYPMCALILSHGHQIHLKTEQKLSGDSVNPLAFALEGSDNKNLIEGHCETVHDRGNELGQEQIDKPLLEDKQSLPDCGQEGSTCPF